MAASRHLWVGGLPEDIGEAGIKDYFSKFGKIEGVKILPQRYPNIGVAAFIDFYTKESAIDAKDAKHKISGCDIRTNFKSKPAENPMQRKWPESTSIEKQEKQGKTRGHQSSSSSSGSDSDSNAGNSSSSSSSSSSSESDKEGESGEKKAKKKGGEAEHVFLKVTGLAHRPERVLQDGLYYEFTRHSPGALVQMYGEEGQEMPWAVVRFKTAKECKAAYSHAQGLALFGSKIKLSPLNTDDFPRGGRNLPLPSLGSGPPPGPMGGGGHMPHPFNPSDDVDPQATRSLFVGNIPKNISVFQLRDIFQRYGDVLDVEIKKMSGNATYGFVLFYDLMSAIHAKQYMDGENVHGNHIRVGFGKGTPSKTLWVDGIDPNTAEPQLERHMAKHGRVLRLGIDRQRCCAMVQYDDAGAAKEALNSVKGTFLGNSKRLMTDFANRDARAAFFSRLEGGGGGGGGGGPPPRGFPGPGMYNPSYGPGPRGGGMMMPRPGMHMMGMGRGGFPPHGHGPPMDFYYNPYMDDNMGYYGGGRPPFHGGPGPMGMRRFSHGRGPFEEGFDEYEEELRAFTRKREWEKEHEKRKEKRKRHSSESESDETDSDDLSLRRKRKSSREKDKHKKASKKDKSKEKEKDTGKEKKSAEKSEGEMDSDGDEKREDARIKATQKSRDLREKLKKKSRRRKEKEAKSDGEASSESESSEETEVKKVKKEKSKEKDRGKEREKNKDKSKVPKKGKGIEREDKSTTPSRHSKSPLSPPPKPPVKEPPKAKEKGRHSAKEQEKDWDKTERAAKPKPPELVEPPPVSRNGKLKKGNLRSESSNEGEEQKSTPHTKDIHERKSEVIKSPPSAHIPDTPQSPVQEEKTRVKEKLESDLSSGEDFKDGEFEPVDEPLPPPKPKVTEKENSSSDPDSKPQHRPVVKQRERLHEYERTPKLLSPNLEMETEGHHELTARHFFSGEESDDTKAMEAGLAAVKKPRKLPRRYQLEEEEPSFVPSSRREKYRESKETRDRPEKRHHLPPTTPSPPPAFVSHRRRHHPSPPPPEYLERRWHRRGRPYSPGHYPPPRRYSRSPPGYPPSPPHRGRSPFSGSPPPRARTPIQRPRDRGMPRHRYESPPYNLPPRGKYPRRGSPPSPPHHRYHSPSPPPRSRSPRRRHLRHRSPSISPPYRSPPHRSPPHRSPPHRSPPRRSPPRRSPPRRSPPRRRERSHSSESERSSSRYPDDRYDSRRKLKRPVYSRTPSPRGKHHDPDKGSYQQLKRQRMEESHPKSPSSTPPPPKEDPKPGKPDKTSSHAPPSRFSSSDVSSGSQKYPSQVKGRGSSDQQSYMHQQQQVQPVSSHMKVPPSHYHQPPLMQPHAQPQQPHLDPQQTNNLLDLLRRYPVMWQGHLTLKNDSAAVQLHFLSGNLHLAKVSLPQQSDQRTPALRISQRMRLEQTQLEGVDRRMQNESEYCLLLALPCGRDANDVRTQTHALKNSLITYLLQKQAAGIINVQGPQTGFVLHIFPPCPFSQAHLSRVAPDLLSSASDNCHLMIMVATM